MRGHNLELCGLCGVSQDEYQTGVHGTDTADGCPD